MKKFSRIQLSKLGDCVLCKMKELNAAKSVVMNDETREAIQKEINNLYGLLDILCQMQAE